MCLALFILFDKKTTIEKLSWFRPLHSKWKKLGRQALKPWTLNRAVIDEYFETVHTDLNVEKALAHHWNRHVCTYSLLALYFAVSQIGKADIEYTVF